MPLLHTHMPLAVAVDCLSAAR